MTPCNERGNPGANLIANQADLFHRGIGRDDLANHGAHLVGQFYSCDILVREGLGLYMEATEMVRGASARILRHCDTSINTGA
jgi:hypothetical protein